jgi:DeoR family transcriptional regulator of aga operon
MKTQKRGSTVERRKKILQIINNAGQVFIDDLRDEFGVSDVTIRNDLEQLEKKNLLVRARGGAMKVETGVSFDYHVTAKDKLHMDDKMKIGRKAGEMIHDNDTIILDSGTTTHEIVKSLENLKNITVVSNALNLISQLIQLDNINLIIPGGYLRKNSLSLVGPLAEKNIMNLFVDKAFIGVDGFDTRHGIYTPNIEEASFNEMMIRNSREVIVVCDSSKFHRRSLAYICGIERIHYVVTDSGIPEDDRKRLEDVGIKVIIG